MNSNGTLEKHRADEFARGTQIAHVAIAKHERERSGVIVDGGAKIVGLVARFVAIYGGAIRAVTGRAFEKGATASAGATSNLKAILDAHTISGNHIPRM